MKLIHRQSNTVPIPRGGPFITKDKRFYRSFVPLWIIITLQCLATLMVSLVDNIMLGRYSELALSGATLVNQIQFLVQQVMAGIGTGVSVLGSQYWGKQQTDPIRRIVSVGMKFAMLLGIVFFLITLLSPDLVIGIFTSDAAVIAEGKRYLGIMCWTYLIFAMSSTLMYSLQSVETAFIGTVMAVSTIVINACLNYCLIYGNFGFPELGIRGAGYATLTSRIVELLIIFLYVLFIDRKLRMRLKDIFSFDFGYLRDFMRAALPVMISGFLWGVAQGAQTAVLGHMSAVVIAANSIATVVSQIFIVFSSGSQIASSIIMGKTVGAEEYSNVRPYTNTLQMLFLLIGFVSSLAMFLCRDAIVGFYSVSAEAKELARTFLTLFCAFVIGSCYEWPVQGGIIAGGGDPKYQGIMDNLFMWLFTIPSAIISAFVFHAPPWVVFCFLKSDQILKCIPNAIYCNSYRWVRVLTRREVLEDRQ